MAQLVIAAAGAAIAGAFPGVGGALAAFAFTAIGNALFAPTQKSQGPRLSDLKVSGTETGQPIPYFEGKFRTAGQIAWASDRREIATTTEAGKGGGGVEATTYTYEIDILYLLSSCEAEALARVWNNGKLEYNNLPDAGIGTAVASATTELWRRITFYSGAADQLPDPTYESAVGLGNAPAYRGRATVFIEGLQLGGSGQIPNLSFEVFRSVTLADVSTDFALFALPSPYNASKAAVYEKSAWFIYNETNGSPTFKFLKSKRYGAFSFKRAITVNGRASFFYPVWVQTNASPRLVFCSFNTGFISGGVNIEQIDPETGVVSQVLAYVPSGNSEVLRPQSRYCAYDEVQSVWVISTIDAVSGTDVTSPFIIRGGTYTRCPPIASLTALAAHDGFIYALANPGGTWRVARYDYTGAFVDEVVDTGGAFGGSGLTTYTAWVRVDADGQAWAFNARRGRLFKITTNFEEVSTAANVDTYNSNDQDGVFVATDSFAAFGYDLPTTTVSYHFRRFKTPTAVQPTVQAVVERLCARAGLDASQIDASALSTITRPVRSLVVSQVTSIRQVLEALGSGYYFGWCLSDKLYARPRGGSSVATIPYADLGASDAGGEAEPFELKSVNDLELRAQVALNYSNVSADYNTGTEYSDRLLVSQTSTDVIELPLGFTPSEAKGVADTIVMDSAASVFKASIAVMDSYSRLEPTDVITVIDRDGSAYRMRIEKKAEADSVLKLDLVADDASVLTSAGITSSDYASGTVVAFSADTTLRLLDIPILRDADDPLGIYAAFAGESAPWPGAALFKSPDGSTFERRQTVSDAAAMGSTITALSNWALGFVFDETSTVTVIMSSGTLSSYTREQIFDGLAPAYLIGSEIVYARSASLIAANTYLLSGFLRGLRGTEWAMSGHAAFEDFTVLSTSGLRRESVDTSEIGAVRYFKAPTLGRSLSTTDAQSITLVGVGKKPFSPANLRGDFGSPEPSFPSVSLLLHFDGTNGQASTTDSGPLGLTVTLTSSTLSSATPKFGATSLNLTGGASYAEVPGAASLEMRAGDFTLECWVWFAATGADQTIAIYDNGGNSTSSIQFLLSQAGGGFNFQWFIAGTGYAISGGSAATSQWIHLAAVRAGTVMTFYVDGVSVGSNTFGAGSLNAPGGGTLRIGRRQNNSLSFTGRVDDLRLTKGVARYSSNFTPPAAAFPDLSAGSTIQISWDRRTRLAKNFTNGYAPLGEAVASYEVDVFSDNTYTALRRTLTSSVESVAYTAAQQIADFGALQTALYVDVYQLSAVVGRGYKLRGAV